MRESLVLAVSITLNLPPVVHGTTHCMLKGMLLLQWCLLQTWFVQWYIHEGYNEASSLLFQWVCLLRYIPGYKPLWCSVASDFAGIFSQIKHLMPQVKCGLVCWIQLVLSHLSSCLCNEPTSIVHVKHKMVWCSVIFVLTKCRASMYGSAFRSKHAPGIQQQICNANCSWNLKGRISSQQPPGFVCAYTCYMLQFYSNILKSGKLLMIALMPWDLVRKCSIIACGRVLWGFIKMDGSLSQAPGTQANKTAYPTDRKHFPFGNTLSGDITMY